MAKLLKFGASLATALFLASLAIGLTSAPAAAVVKIPGPMDLRLTSLGTVVAAEQHKPLFKEADLEATTRGPNFAQASLKCLAIAVYFESRGFLSTLSLED